MQILHLAFAPVHTWYAHTHNAPMHAREHPTTIHTAVFVHNSIGGYALGGWKSRYSRQTESSGLSDKRHERKGGMGSTEVKPNFRSVSVCTLLSLSLSYTHEHNRAQLSGNMGEKSKEWHRMFSLNKHHLDTWSGAERGSSVAYASALALVYPAAPSGAT